MQVSRDLRYPYEFTIVADTLQTKDYHDIPVNEQLDDELRQYASEKKAVYVDAKIAGISPVRE